ncbi:MAG: Permease of the drug/metabolite transporter (DMT) superfamily [uncultured Campylobacterales bacterium]|uniref:Permease of the drug/metabolite transporter (DMT) superfamily n=1 Tax=uncultured Campylobacterales bacterium TaxID=352960 RepID=A0A6S6SP16_9BACT|nr:MAG: Permease of the drug/metabolite transporter (DMT) superfamily [uncultured Campylobacterales bacterium]
MNISQKANILGILTIFIWSGTTIVMVMLKQLPVMQFLFCIMFLVSSTGIVILKFKKKSFRLVFDVPKTLIFICVFGILVNYLFYFLALQNAPAREVNLINYLWPLMIVIFVAFLPRGKFSIPHFIGALFGLSITFWIISKDGINFEWKYLDGYIYVFLGAFTWSVYSVLLKLYDNISTFSVSLFSFIVGVISLVLHLIYETTYIPNLKELFFIFYMGIVNIGGGIYMWDYAMKRGNQSFLAMLSYSIPILSTLWLVIFNIK